MKQFLSILLLAILISFGCRKGNDNIPRVPVNEYLNLSLPSYNSLNIVGNWIYYQGGNRGLIICRTSVNQFIALERTCSYDPTLSTSIVYGVKNNVYGVDSVCGSQFSLFDGSVMKGPATSGLLHYQTYFDGTYLHIYN